MEVLVLNAAYQPIRVDPWRDVMTKLYSERAKERVEIVACYDDRFICTVYAKIPMPSVVRHVRFVYHNKKQIKYSKDNIWARDRGRCQYCGLPVPRKKFTRDHVIPKSRGGKSTFENIVTACAICNGKKRDMTPEEAGMKLRSTPRRPDVLPKQFKAGLGYEAWMPIEWKIFFRSDYWHGTEGNEK